MCDLCLWSGEERSVLGFWLLRLCVVCVTYNASWVSSTSTTYASGAESVKGNVKNCSQYCRTCRNLTLSRVGKKTAFFWFDDECAYYLGDEIMLLLGKKKHPPNPIDVSFEGAVSRVCFGSLTAFVKEDDLLGTYWSSTFSTVAVVFQFCDASGIP